MHLDGPENKRLKPDTDDYNSDDDYSDFMKNGNPEVDVEKKKRRGTIEKRRRDRINSSLTELKELVPNAVVKQNTTKLEKAEILKLTVDYLKELKCKDPSRFLAGSSQIYESRLTGFRECLNEISKYLLHREGMSYQNPIYQGLMAHLQYCYQSFSTPIPYPQETAFPIDPTHGYLQMPSPGLPFDLNAGQSPHDPNHKVPCWPDSVTSLYSSPNINYSTPSMQSNPFSFPHKTNQTYDLTTSAAVSSGLNMAGNTMTGFKLPPTTAGSMGVPINPANSVSTNQSMKGYLFNSFCNASANSNFHHVANNSARNSLV